jgi:quercetin dioxygenase-like cupin family protein
MRFTTSAWFFASILTLTFSGAFMASRAQDQVALDPGIARVEFENEQIRVVRIRYAPHQKGHMHSHPARLSVTITGNDVRVDLPDGKSTTAKRKPHELFWSDAVTHQAENLSDGPLENIEIELKASKGAGVQVAPNAGPHSGTGTEVDPVPVEQEPHHRIVFENQYVRVLDVVVPPGAMTLFHKHSLDNVSVQLSDTTLNNQALGEEWTSRPVAEGQVGFRAGTKTPYTHRIMNAGATEFHVIDVEILP